jgi:hypothetical protein
MLCLWSILLVILNAVFWVLEVLGFPGNWLIVISTCLFAWWRWDDRIFSIYTLIAIEMLAVVSELFTFFSGTHTVGRVINSLPALVAILIGAIIGAILGTFFIPILFLGTLPGICIGARLGACSVAVFRTQKLQKILLEESSEEKWEWASHRYSIAAGPGEFLGIPNNISIGIVVHLGIIIWIIVTIAAFWP